jgi:rhamnose transport system permease protein
VTAPRSPRGSRTEGVTTSATATRSRLAGHGWEAGLVVMLVVSVIVAARLSPFYLDLDQILLAMRFTMVAGMLALGLMVVVVLGEIDLSQAAIVAFGAIIFASCSQWGLPIWAAVPIVVVLCMVLGLLNGVLVARLGLPSLAVTIGTLAAYRGLAFIIGGDRGYTGFDESYLWLGRTTSPIAPAIVLFLATAIVLAIVMLRSNFGAYCYTIGNSATVARFSGVPVNRVKVLAFILSATIAALAAWILIGQFGSARGDNADGITLLVVTAVVLGGVDIYGGRGSILGVVLAVLILGTLSNGMGLANVAGPTQQVVFGLLLIGSILLPRIVSRLTSSMRTRTSATEVAGSVRT